ncbi:hypothetical protein DERF_005097 [Dermatophagoides farinae]|uniref:non-specific serine/threonine protein kinase n=1 Tax=Dermatophagoides farinae TaxID=6954 RepID=A0A922I691_DERFA|nr:hypothetical protein DERF_005097 [Dermatophagoides farinae]
MKKILLLTITTITVTTLIECYTGVPRMPQFGLRIPRAPRFRPPSFTPSSNVQSPQSQLMSQASSHPFASQIRPSSLHMGSMIGHSPQPGFPSPMSHHQISSPSSSHSMPFPMRPGPPMMDIPHSMIRPPHHPIAPIFASMHHHTQASHPPPSYHPKPSFYHGKTDDCPFPGCEMEPTYNGEAPVPSPYQVESPMIPSLTSPDSSPLDLSPRPPLDHEQYGSRQPMLSMGKQPVKVVYKPVVKLVKVPVEVPVKVRQPYPVKVPVPVQIPFPVKVIQREKIMFPIAVPFGQVLPVTALGSPAQISQEQPQQQQQQYNPQQPQQQQQQQYQPQQQQQQSQIPMKQPQTKSHYHGPGEYQQKLTPVNANGEPYGSQQQQQQQQQNIQHGNQEQQYYPGNQQQQYNQQENNQNQNQQHQYNQVNQQQQYHRGNQQQQMPQKFRQEVVYVDGPNYRGISDINFGGVGIRINNENNNNNYDNQQQQGYGYSSPMNDVPATNYNNNENQNQNYGQSNQQQQQYEQQNNLRPTIGHLAQQQQQHHHHHQQQQQQQNYNGQPMNNNQNQNQNYGQSNQQPQQYEQQNNLRPNFIIPPFTRNFISENQQQQQPQQQGSNYVVRILNNLQQGSSVNYGNENTPTQGGFVAPLKNYRTYHDEGDNDNSISIDRGMVGWSPIRIPPQSSSHQMAESRMSNDGIDDDGEKEAVDSFMQDRVDNDNDFAFGASSHIDSIHRPVSIETPYVTGKLIKSPMIISKMHKRS